MAWILGSLLYLGFVLSKTSFSDIYGLLSSYLIRQASGWRLSALNMLESPPA